MYQLKHVFRQRCLAALLRLDEFFDVLRFLRSCLDLEILNQHNLPLLLFLCRWSTNFPRLSCQGIFVQNLFKQSFTNIKLNVLTSYESSKFNLIKNVIIRKQRRDWRSWNIDSRNLKIFAHFKIWIFGQSYNNEGQFNLIFWDVTLLWFFGLSRFRIKPHVSSHKHFYIDQLQQTFHQESVLLIVNLSLFLNFILINVR